MQGTSNGARGSFLGSDHLVGSDVDLRRCSADEVMVHGPREPLSMPGAIDIYVIGKMPDIKAYVGRPGYTVLILNEDWSVPRNEAWIQRGIDSRAIFKLVSEPGPKTVANRDLAYPNDSLSVFGKEARQLHNAGYRLVGDLYLPPEVEAD